MYIQRVNNIVKYVPTEVKDPVFSANITLKANKTQKLYPVMQTPTSIL